MDYKMPEWVATMIDGDALSWTHQLEEPRGSHGYLHVVDGQLVYIGVTCGGRKRATRMVSRSRDHRMIVKSGWELEVRYIPMRTLADAFEWEYWAINKAASDGHILENRTGSAALMARGRAFMAIHLPKTFERLEASRIRGEMSLPED